MATAAVAKATTFAAVATFVVALAGITVPATRGAHVAVDEPQYLLSATSLGEDLDLDISDELEDERWREYHEADLPVQTEVLEGGRQVSPHDPLLPLYLAVPMLVGGWVGAKVAMALLAAALAGLLVRLVVRSGVEPRWAVVGVCAFTCAPPLSVYATQVYPELPAALVVALAITWWRSPWVVGVCATALPWLSVKYAPVAAALVLVHVWRHRRTAPWLLGGLALSGLVFAVGHQAIFGGLTAYATGDHFAGGELDVVGTDPDYWGRARRLVGLLVDERWGLVPWQPAWLLLPWAVRRTALLVPLAAGWLTATFVALTAHGFWWPGRQVVVVLPVALLLIVTAAPRWAVAAALVLGVTSTAWLVLDDAVTWVVHFQESSHPWYRAMRPLLPDLRPPVEAGDEVRYVLAAVALIAVTGLGLLRRRAPACAAGTSSSSRST